MKEEGQVGDQQAPWWGIAILYLALTPFALLAFFAFKLLALVWQNFDGSAGAEHAIFVFAIGGCLLFAYVIMAVRQVYVEFIVPTRSNHVRDELNRPNVP